MNPSPLSPQSRRSARERRVRRMYDVDTMSALPVDLSAIEQERDALQARVMQLELELAARTHELMATTMSLTQREQMLRDLATKLNDARRHLPAEQQASFGEALRSLGIDRHSPSATIEQGLAIIPHGTVDALARRYPSLTPAELRICAMVRIGLSTKEMSMILHRSERGIESQRFSIRRKLGLSREQCLMSALLTSEA